MRRPRNAEAMLALQEFEVVGLRCIDALDKEGLRALRRLGAVAKPAPSWEASAKASASEAEVKGVRKMLNDFDGDGLLNVKQCKEVLLRLGLGDHLSEEELDVLISVADEDNDGLISLKEFADWLYGGSMAPGGQQLMDNLSEDDLLRQLAQTREAVQALELRLADAERQSAAAAQAAETRAERSLRKAEQGFERDLEASYDFWRSIAQNSASPKLGQVLDLSGAELLGNGKYGFVLKANRKGAVQSTIVVKLLGVRWAHVAAKEWQQAQLIGLHASIIKYEDVMLHADDDEQIARLLHASQEQGKLNSRTKRVAFPDRYLCLLEEYMNRGTVQDWMDKDMLFPGGMLVAMQRVASALAHIHLRGVTHNDIKPENILLRQKDEDDPRSEVTVKLADLGLAAVSTDRTNDFQQYGMTVFCMTTGEKFGSRKFQPELARALAAEVAALTGEGSEQASGVGAALVEVPGLLRSVWAQDVTMAEVRDSAFLQGWSFFDGEDASAEASARRATG